MWRSDGAGGSAASARSAAASDSGLLGRERPLRHRRERRRAEAEVAVRLGVELLLEPARGSAEAPILRQPLGELARSVVGIEVLERHLLFLREEPARLQLEERGDEDEELAVDLQIADRRSLQKRQHDLDDLDVRELELLLENERQKEVEGPFEGVEVERELCDGAHRHNSMVSGGRGLWERSSSAPAAERWAAGAPTSRAGAATR